MSLPRDFMEDFIGTSLWDTVPVKHLFGYRKENNTGMKESHRLALTMGGVVDRSLDDTDGLQSSDYGTYQIFEKGDLAFKLIDLQNIKTSRVGLVPRRGIMSPAYIRLSPRVSNILPEFYYWYFYAAYLGNIFNGLGGGIRQNLSQSELLEFPVPNIAYEEQTAIAAFLDRETARIDGLIEKKGRFIELLKEKRAAVITHAVTKGIDADVQMKDSKIGWLGNIPENWKVAPLKSVGEAIIGLTYSPDQVVDEGEGTLVLRSSNIQSGSLSFHDNVYVSAPIPKKLKTRANDLLICSRNGSRDLIGKCALIDKATEGQSFGAFTTVFRSEMNEFIYFIMNSDLFKFQAGMFMTSTINQLTTGMLNNFRVPLPPLESQSEIVEHLNLETGHLNDLISTTNRSIELLKEKRSALITAVVTGKIDVRSVA